MNLFMILLFAAFTGGLLWPKMPEKIRNSTVLKTTLLAVLCLLIMAGYYFYGKL